MRSSIELIYSLFIAILIGCFSCSNELSPKSQDTGLIGVWSLAGYENLIDGTIENSPDNVDEIWIEFSDSVFNGNTGRNNFFGPYKTQNDLLILEALDGTEINESSWGIRFFDSMREAYKSEFNDLQIIYSLNGDLLKMEYNSNQAFLFKRTK